MINEELGIRDEELGMRDNNIIKDKSRDFAIRIIRLYKYLCEEKNEYVLSKQLLRSGTSIGANVNEALCGISKKDFLSKMYIAYKETAESMYWLELEERQRRVAHKRKKKHGFHDNATVRGV